MAKCNQLWCICHLKGYNLLSRSRDVLSVTYSLVNRLCGEHSVNVGQNVINQPPATVFVFIVFIVFIVVYRCVARHLRRRRSHLSGHVLSTRRQSASQDRARYRRWSRSHAIDLPDEESCGGSRRRPRSRLSAACVQLGAISCWLPTLAGRRRSRTAVYSIGAGTSTSNIISTTWRRLYVSHNVVVGLVVVVVVVVVVVTAVVTLSVVTKFMRF